MLSLNLLQDPKPGRPTDTSRSHLGERCPVCKSSEKVWDVSRGTNAGRYRYERCAVCRRRAARASHVASRQKYQASPKGLASRRRCSERRRSRSNEQAAQNAKRWRTTNPENAMFEARKRAKTRGLAFDIEIDDVEIPFCCPVLGCELVAQVGLVQANSPSLDRIDQALGYVKGNVWVISWRANRIKNDATLAELEALVAALKGRG